MTFSKLIFQLFIIIAVTSPWSTGQATDISNNLANFNAEHQSMIGKGFSDRKKSDIIENKYILEFKSLNNINSFQDISDPDIIGYFDATYTTAFYSLKYIYVQRMIDLYRELIRRHIETSNQEQYVYEMLIATRRFYEAQALRRNPQHSEEELLPTIRGSRHEAQPGAWAIDNAGSTISYEEIDLTNYSVIVIAHPLCHFSQAAFNAIQSRPELKIFFEKRALILTPQEGHLNIASIAQWNAAHPLLKMRLVDIQQYWPPQMTDWSTPVFYFFSKGRFTGSVTGWPPNGNIKELIRMINNIDPSALKSAS